MLGIEQNEDPDLNIEAMVKYEDVFLERKGQLKKSLDQISSEPLVSSQGEMVKLLNISLSGLGEQDEEFQEAIITYLKLIILQDQQAADRLLENDANEDFVKFVLDSIIEYGQSLQRLNFQISQGKRWWSDIDVDRIIKENGIRHHHKITIDKRKTISYHSTPYSDWMIINHMLDSIYDSYVIADTDRLSLIDLEAFDQVRSYVYAFENDLEQNGVELAKREDLIETREPQDNEEENE